MYDITRIHNRLLERHRPSDLLSVLAHSPEDGLYYHEEGSLSFSLLCAPLMWADEGKISQLQVLLAEDYPKGTILQVSLWSSPDVESSLCLMNELREGGIGHDEFPGKRVARELIQRRAEYLRRHSVEPIDPDVPVRVRDIQILVCLKFPCSGRLPTEREIENARRMRHSITQTLATLGMAPRALDPENYIRVLGAMVNWDADASWRSAATIYDPDRLVREQVFDAETSVRVDDGGLWLGHKRVKTLCTKRFPDYIYLGQAAQYLGDFRTGHFGIRENVLITLNVLFPDAEEERARMGSKKNTATWQALGPLSRYVPRLRAQKDSFDVLFQALEDGDRVIKAYMSFCLFADDEESATAATSNLITYYRGLGFRIQEDRYICLPVFLNALPANADPQAAKGLMRYRTMAGRHAGNLLPVIGDWKGTGTPVFSLVSRNGQLMNIDLFDSHTNYSALVAAESGSGKSFFVQDLLLAYQSLGADIYVIDVGRSFKNTCETLGGDCIEFTPKSEISLNPFSNIIDYDDQSDLLLAVLLAMISPKGEVTEFQISQLRSVVHELWDIHGPSANIDLLSEALRNHRTDDNHIDQRVSDMGMQLFPFTSRGEYGRWFNSPATIDFKKPLTLCELTELKERHHLQEVVLIQLISVIQRAMYLGPEDRPKILILEESWDLITGDPMIGAFIERGVRQFRKHKGSAVIILQSVNDLYNSPVGTAIAENTANKFLLGQTAEAIDGLIKSGRLSLGEAASDVLKTVHTKRGKYSEIFVYTRSGGGIGRLYVDRFTQLLYTTDPNEKTAIQQRIARGMAVEQAILDVIRSEQGMRKAG